MKRWVVRFFVALVFFNALSHSPLLAQRTKFDYHRADSVAARFNDLVYHTISHPHWIEGANAFWYSERSEEGRFFWVADVSLKTKKHAFDHTLLAHLLSSELQKTFKPDSLPIHNVTIRANQPTIEFTLDNYRWEFTTDSGQLIRKNRVRPPRNRDQVLRWDIRDELSNQPVVSPDSAWTAFIRNYNLFIRCNKNNEVHQLSFDGSAGEPYSSFVYWSPNSQKLLTNKVRLHTKRYVHFVESSPMEQLQPILHSFEYLKPGDALPIHQPRLFDIETKKAQPFDTTPFLHQYSLSHFAWRKDSRSFTFEFNQRGHQVYQVVEVDAETARVKVLIHEQYQTFFCYSSKRFRHDVDDGKEIIWMSERNGWNHLYLIDGSSGRIINPITRGEWVVRQVLHVDETHRVIYFYGSGKNKGEDPYHLHLYRVRFDGSDLKDLTPERANHQIVFSPNRLFFVNTYSRIDLPPVTVVRSTSDGSVVMEIARADISKLLESGWQMPEVFTAKGRDGKTDIWGMIYRPSNFDASLTYPVIEYIYAGPHSAFVPKSFHASYLFSGLAELGFIIVFIDGMGTNYRSKAFHDVCWMNLKDAGFPDRILWMKEAGKKYPYMDLERVGIYGSSAGGQSSTGALLFHPDFYKVAVSSVGCHDNRMDKIWWNEQWMGYPVGKHYETNSNVVNAHLLQGKLMLIVGEMDRNVDPASTMQLANALIKANKDFDLLVIPGLGHSMGGSYGERRRRDFFVRHLLQQTTPNWNIK